MASLRWMSTLLIKWKRRQFERKRAQKKQYPSPSSTSGQFLGFRRVKSTMYYNQAKLAVPND
ncbi:hypothetical protein T10_12296, partial [Trichinella papuae]